MLTTSTRTLIVSANDRMAIVMNSEGRTSVLGRSAYLLAACEADGQSANPVQTRIAALQFRSTQELHTFPPPSVQGIAQ